MLLLFTEYEHDYSYYDACATSYDSEIEDCTPADYGVTVTA